MKVKSTTKIGNVLYEFECDERLEKEALSKAIVFANPPTYCDVCKNTDPSKFKLVTNKDKQGHIYIKIRCINAKCGATCGLGEYKDGSGYFWRRPFEIYQPKGGNNGYNSGNARPNNGPANFDDPNMKEDVDPEDIPF